MLHARRHGETFGLACAEFAVAGKPVLTSDLGEGEHRRILGDRALVYRDAAQLKQLLTDHGRIRSHRMAGNGYEGYTLERVAPLLRAALGACLCRAWGGSALV